MTRMPSPSGLPLLDAEGRHTATNVPLMFKVVGAQSKDWVLTTIYIKRLSIHETIPRGVK